MVETSMDLKITTIKLKYSRDILVYFWLLHSTAGYF